MTVTITLPESNTPRTQVAAKVACDYVSYTISKLPSTAYTDLYKNGFISGIVDAEFVGAVHYTITADK